MKRADVKQKMHEFLDDNAVAKFGNAREEKSEVAERRRIIPHPSMVKRIGTPGPHRAILMSALAFLVTAPPYLSTMSRTYGFIDRGELAAVAATLGIAHPTGYPTLTILGHPVVRCFTLLAPVLVLNALSALWSALAVSLMLLV